MIIVLANDLAVVSWVYKAAAILESGDQNLWEKAGATLLFKKDNGNWKVINYQESSSPPVIIPPE